MDGYFFASDSIAITNMLPKAQAPV